jgi:hypothetical protein
MTLLLPEERGVVVDCGAAGSRAPKHIDFVSYIVFCGENCLKGHEKTSLPRVDDATNV